MNVYINVIDPSYLNGKYWGNINRIFKQQSPNWSPGKRLFGKSDYTDDEYSLFIIYIALLYREMLKEIVLARKYEKFWIPLNPKYLKSKVKKGLYPNTWMRSGILVDNISISLDNNKKKIRIGIDENLKYTTEGRDIKVLDVARFNEYGTTTHTGEPGIPARPLFRRVRDRISKDMGKYYLEFQHLISLIGE